MSRFMTEWIYAESQYKYNQITGLQSFRILHS